MKHATKAAALALSAALSVTLAPQALAQSSVDIPGVSDYLRGGTPPRTPIRTDYPDIQGLPEGVSVNRVEWLSARRIALFINSKAMPEQPIQVQVLLARDWYKDPSRSFPSVWALDGMRAVDSENGWTLYTNIEQFFSDKNVNVVLPVGGESSFYSDWQRPDNGKHYMWETFLTQELIPVLREGYRTNGDRAVVGLSMGGTAAINLAERRPDLFNFAGSFSGYLDTTSVGMPPAIQAALSEAGGYDSTAMWGPYGSQDWIDHDPKLGIENLQGKTVYVSAGSGNDDYGTPDSVAKNPAKPAGIGLEVISRMTSQTFVDRAKRVGVEPIVSFRPSGVHDWPYWQFEMVQAWPHMADALKLADEDRGASCLPVGAIAESTKSGVIGNCVNNEYDVPGGKAEDFVSGRAYWSPKTGAHPLWGRIGSRYAEMGGPESWLGFPTSSEIELKKGRMVTFEHGNIYWSMETGPVAVPNDIIATWGTQGYENGDLGLPVKEMEEKNGYRIQQFQDGIVVNKDGEPGHWLKGVIAKKYLEMGTVESPLGAPKSNEIPIKGGAFHQFERGNLYWSFPTGAHAIYYGDIFEAWGKKGYEQGEFGYPTSDQSEIPAGGQEISFERGKIKQVNGQIKEEK